MTIQLTIESKHTAGPFAETDSWITPVPVLAQEILRTEGDDGFGVLEVVVRWVDGVEITYRNVTDDEDGDGDDGDEAEVWGATFANWANEQIDIEDDQYGWTKDDAFLARGDEEVEDDELLAHGWTKVYL